MSTARVRRPTFGRTSLPALSERPLVALLSAGIAFLVALNAVFGGVEMIRSGFGLPVEWLANTPFSSWTWPGILLLATVAVPHFIVAGYAAFGPQRTAALGMMLAGGGLVLWILLQLALLQQYFFLQPILAGIGLVELGLGVWWRRELRER